MKKTLISLILIAVAAPAAWAQDRIYRCGNEYTNNAQQARERGCKLVEGGNVTIVRGTAPAPAAPAAPAAGGGAAPAARSAGTAPASAPRIDNAEQRKRDADAKAILQQELRRAEAKQAELEKEYKGGEPDKIGGEARNHQKYLDRVAELKAAIERNQSDIEGIKRELGRLGP